MPDKSNPNSKTQKNHAKTRKAESRSSNILLCGVGPIPQKNPSRLYAPGLRLWGMAQALLAAGCAVDLLEVKFGQSAAAGAGASLHRLELTQKSKKTNLPTRKIKSKTEVLESEAPPRLVRGRLSARTYDAVVSTTDVLNAACAEAAGPLPLWCDFNGHAMAERQSMAWIYGSDEGLASQWDYVLAPMLRADRLSSCSAPQRLAMIGELGPCGRLNSHTDGTELVVSLPPSVVLTEFPTTGKELRGELVPEDAAVVLWTGGYNTWADPETLAAGLLGAMDQNEKIHYVSTGGAIEGHDDKTFTQFRKIVDPSAHADRFHFVGWVDTREMPDYYALADVAVNVDRATLDTELGWRNRIQEWVCAGVPVVTTDLCELTHDLGGQGLVDTFGAGDAEDLAQTLLTAAGRPPKATALRVKNARDYLWKAYAPEKIYAPLTDWAKEPRRSPDLAQGAAVEVDGVPFEIPDNPLSRRRAQEWLEAWKKTPGPSGEEEKSSFLQRVARKFKVE